MSRLLTLKIVLEYSEPLVWREIGIDGRIRLSCLHEIIQTGMGWENCHLHLFHKKRELFGPMVGELPDLGVEDEEEIAVVDLLPRKGSKLFYEYDFGDSWGHHIEVLSTRKTDGPLFPPVLLAGAGACPLEEIGGIERYCDLVALLGRPDHPDYDRLEYTIGEDFDPNAFDFKAVYDRLDAYGKKQKRPRRVFRF